ncbi:MAG: winged helix-turn-helix transcriptional regulator [Candidatus Thorarchaeota archaeon]
MDKTLLLKLLGNCRASYRRLAREMGVTCPTIKRRVDRLVEAGVIENFTIDLSQETLGVGWAYAEITTDLTEDRDSLIRSICSHSFTNEVFAVGVRNYVAFAELPYPDGVYDYGKFLRGLDGVESMSLSPIRQMPSVQLADQCKYTTRGKKVNLGTHHLSVLKYLVNRARMSIQDLAKRVGYKPKRVRRILRELEESEGVHFTIRFNPAAENGVGFILKISFNELEVSPGEIAYWLEEEFPSEFWMSFLLLSEPVLINYMTTVNLSKIENLIRRMKSAPFVENVETMVIYHVEKTVECSSSISSLAAPHITLAMTAEAT